VKDSGKFKSWLVKRGAIVLDATNQWEVVRFKTVNGVSVIYTRANGHLTFTGESEEAYKAYKANRVWKAVDRKRQNLRARKARLATRDGKKCFCCNAKLGYDELTIEHILSFSHGGTDNDNNLCLVCLPCNKLLGNKPITKKIGIMLERRTTPIFLDEAASMEGFEELEIKPNSAIKTASTPPRKNIFNKLFGDK
jgi:hypothetical protein